MNTTDKVGLDRGGTFPNDPPVMGATVIMIASSAPPHIGGVEQHLMQVIPVLRKMGWRIHLLAMCREPPADEVSLPGVKYLGGHSRLGRIRALRKLIRENPGALLHYHDYWEFARWGWAVMHPKRQCFVTFHGFEGRFPIHRRSIMWRRIIDYRAARNISVGAFIPKYYGTREDVIIYGAPREIEAGLREKSSRLVFMGRIADDTGIFLLLHALAILSDRAPRVDIFGGGPAFKEANRLAAELGVRAQFRGTVSDPIPILQGANLAFVSGYLSLWDAMATSTTILTAAENDLKFDYLSCFPGAGEVFEVAKNSEELAAHIAKLSANPDLCRTREERGRIIAGRISWDGIARQYEALWANHGQ